MQRTFLLIIYSLVCITSAHAQVLYGTTFNGGTFGSGTINKCTPSSNLFEVVKTFDNAKQDARADFIQASDGNLYGMSSQGGVNGVGTIFSYTPSNATYSKLQDLDSVNGGIPFGNLLQASNGLLYGMTSIGGNYGVGVIFSFDPVSLTYSRLLDFDNVNGANPHGSLIQASNGLLYGMTTYGGSNGGGVIFSFDLSSNNLSKLYDFEHFYGTNPTGNLMQAIDGKLYGMTREGGTRDGGVIFTFDPILVSYTKLLDFYYTFGSNPSGSLIQANDGKLYGMCIEIYRRGGVIFSFNISTLGYSVVHVFDGTSEVYPNGGRPTGNLVQASDGMFYGMTPVGGSSGNGIIFSLDPSSFVYTKIQEFSYNSGSKPVGSLQIALDGKLYGLTSSGGNSFAGTIFSFDPLSSSFSKLKDFGENGSGSNISAKLIQAIDGKLYGLSTYGGNNGIGVIFNFDPSTSQYTKLYDFSGSDGKNPYGSLIQANDGKLYGMTSDGGNNNFGVIFSFDPASASFIKLMDFDSINGSRPFGSLLQASNGILYGMTNLGGSKGSGIIFSFDPSTSTYSNIHDFDDINGSNPFGNLIQSSNGNLYGLTAYGGSSGGGVIFSFDPSNNNFSKLQDFDYNIGSKPFSSLIEAKDGQLYGMTSGGGSSGDGVIFSYNTSTSTYTNLKDFNFRTGNAPLGVLVQASDGMLYGMTSEGGINYIGVIFSFDPTSSVYSVLNEFNITNGANPFYGSGFVEVLQTPSAISNRNLTKNNIYSILSKDKEKQFNVKVLSNPSSGPFTLNVENSNKHATMMLRVVNEVGNLIEKRNNVYGQQIMQIGNNYHPGIYFVELINGTNRKQLKLIKL